LVHVTPFLNRHSVLLCHGLVSHRGFIASPTILSNTKQERIDIIAGQVCNNAWLSPYSI
jgi:hypothetical protein